MCQNQTGTRCKNGRPDDKPGYLVSEQRDLLSEQFSFNVAHVHQPCGKVFLIDLLTNRASIFVVSRMALSHEPAAGRRRTCVHVAAPVHVVVNLGGAAQHARVQKNGEGCGFQFALANFAGLQRFPQHL